MGIFDKFKREKKPEEKEKFEENDEFASIIDDAANEALAELGLADDEDIGSEETRKRIEEGFSDEAQKEIEDEVKKETESEEVQKKIEDEVKKNLGFR